MVKYGLIDDRGFFEWCENNAAALLNGDAARRTYAIEQSCRAKARIVAADERETSDLRALLNLGHTFAHALEAETGFRAGPAARRGGRRGHGDGLRSLCRLGLCPAADAQRVRAHLGTVGLPVRCARSAATNKRWWDAARLIDHMRGDKKAEAERLTFILARGIGQAFVTRDVDEGALRGLLDGRRRRLRRDGTPHRLPAALSIAVPLVLLCLALSAYMSAAETAITGASRPRMHRLAQQGNRRATLVQQLLERKSEAVNAVLLGNSVDEHPLGLRSPRRCLPRCSARRASSMPQWSSASWWWCSPR